MGLQHPPLTALAAGLLILGSGCITADTVGRQTKNPDVTQPGVLPPPQELAKPAASLAPGAVIQASNTQPASGMSTFPGASTIAKLTGKQDKSTSGLEMAVSWQRQIAYLTDPSRYGAVGPGLVGQMFLFAGPNLDFAEANGTLTVDLVDETPRPAGQPAATPERWQFTKEALKKLKAIDETFGKSYVLFLPWPAYKPDITRVRIAARYDPEHGPPQYSQPTLLTIDPMTPFGTPVWSDHKSTIVVPGANGVPPQPFGGTVPAPGGTTPAPGLLPGELLPGGMQPGAVQPGVGGNRPAVPMSSSGGSGAAPSLPPNLPPIAITAGRP